ncbi:hypothetical protein TWF751_002974 [Orbilia oligospora]|nr:hypothetical protein TWF751_002974 [Orbilia oligospora]
MSDAWGDEFNGLDSGPAASNFKKRKQWEAYILSEADESRGLTANRNYYSMQRLRTTPYEELDLEAEEAVWPMDSISNSGRDGAQSTRSSSSPRSINTTVARKKRRELLEQFYRNSSSLGFQAKFTLLERQWPSEEERIRGRQRFEWWEEGTFSSQGDNHQRHLDEANFVIQSATRSEGLQLSVSEESAWARHATEVLRFVAGPIDSFHPVTISSVTTVDIHHDFFPTLRREAKSHDSSALEAESQAVVCANAILEAWRQLGAPKAYTPPAHS